MVVVMRELWRGKFVVEEEEVVEVEIYYSKPWTTVGYPPLLVVMLEGWVERVMIPPGIPPCGTAVAVRRAHLGHHTKSKQQQQPQ